MAKITLRGAYGDAIARALPDASPAPRGTGRGAPGRRRRSPRRASDVETRPLSDPAPPPDDRPDAAMLAHVGKTDLEYVACSDQLQAALARWRANGRQPDRMA